MILAIYIIGSAIALLVLTVRLHDSRHQLARLRRERDAYAAAIQTSLLAPAVKNLPATPAESPRPGGERR